MPALVEPPVQLGRLHKEPIPVQDGKYGQEATRGPLEPPGMGPRLCWGRSAMHLQSLAPGLTEDRQPLGYKAEDMLPGRGELAETKAQEPEAGWREEQELTCDCSVNWGDLASLTSMSMHA